MWKAPGVCSSLAFQVAFGNSFRGVGRRGVHQGLDLGAGQEQGVEASIICLSTERADGNHWSSWLGEGALAGGGTT